MASSTLLRRNVSLASRVAPTPTGESGSGAGEISRSPANAGSDFLQRPERRPPHQRDADGAAHRAPASANSSEPMGKRLQRWSAGSACKILDQPDVGAGADGGADRLGFRHVGERFPVGIGGHQDVGGAIIGPRDREPLRIGVGDQLEAEKDVAGFEKHPVEIVDVLADRVLADRRAPWAGAAAPARSRGRSLARPAGRGRARRRSN